MTQNKVEKTSSEEQSAYLKKELMDRATLIRLKTGDRELKSGRYKVASSRIGIDRILSNQSEVARTHPNNPKLRKLLRDSIRLR